MDSNSSVIEIPIWLASLIVGALFTQMVAGIKFGISIWHKVTDLTEWKHESVTQWRETEKKLSAVSIQNARIEAKVENSEKTLERIERAITQRNHAE
jgi:hypothetical protein